MFAVVKIIDREKTFLSHFKKRKITSERVLLPNGESFFIITAEKKGGKIPFREILNYSGILHDKILFDRDFEFCDEWSYTPFKPAKLKKKLLLDLAVKTLEELNINPQKTNICIWDAEGTYINELHRLFRFGKKIHVICQNKSIYEKKKIEYLEKYGVCVTLGESFTNCGNEYNVAISHSCEEIPLLFKGIVFTNGEKDFLSAECYEVREISLPFEYERLRPCGIDKMTFASALYECCGAEF